MSLLDTLVPPAAVPADGGLPRPSRQRREEQLATLAVGAVNLVVCIALLAALSSLEPDASVRTTNRLLLAGSIVASLLCLPAVRHGNRLIAGLVLLAAGFLGPGAVFTPFFVIPHYGVAMWMIMRQNRMVKEQAAEKRKQRLEADGGSPARSRSRGRQAAKLADGRQAPGASKRYTPPRQKKRPAPAPDPKRAAASAEEAAPKAARFRGRAKADAEAE